LPVPRAAIELAKELVLARDPDDQPWEAILFLLREYVCDGTVRVRDAVEAGLTRGLTAAATEPDAWRRMQWLRVLAEGAALSDDRRLHEAVVRALPSTIDSLDAIVRRSYEPGEGLPGTTCGEQLRCGSALLAGFDLCGRLPYAMLAEELLRHARREWWSEDTAAYAADFRANCTALRLLCRLAALHANAEYSAAVALAPGGSHARDAARMVPLLVSRSAAHPDAAAELGAALLEWFALQPDLQ